MVEHIKWTISTLQITIGVIKERLQSVLKVMIIWTGFVYLKRRKHVGIENKMDEEYRKT